MEGQSLGSYTIERELGRGGMGAVYVAIHTLLGRRAAVKVLLPALSKDQSLVQRFFNEARAATAIKHPSIVEIYDFGWAPDGSAFIVMELMDGEPLSARIKRHGRLPVPLALTIARQAANALHAAHRAGIVHRDLKPDNVFLVPDIEVAGGERVKLLDFGIAKLTADGHVSQTSTGAIMGTPLYMSPEQCEGARLVDARSDLYSLGCMLFEMVSGRVPFVSEGVGGLIGMHLFMPAPALRSVAPDAPPELEALVAKLLAKPPGERYQSAEELAGALSRLGAASGAMMAAAPMPSFPGSAASPLAGASWPGPPPSGVVTTMSSAAGARSVGGPPIRSRRGLWLAAGGLAAVGAVVAIALAAGGDGGGGGEKVSGTAEAVDAAPGGGPALDAAAAPAITVDASPTAAAPAADARRAEKPVPVTSEPAPPSTTRPPTPPTPVVPAPPSTTRPPTPPTPVEPAATDDAAFEALHEQAKAAGWAGDYEKALALCQRELKLRPDEPRALFNCATFAFQNGNCTLAERYLKNLHTAKADKLRQRCVEERAAGRSK